jgi:hypothetical protein
MCTTQPNPRSESGDDDDIWADCSEDGQHGADHRELGREAAARHQHFYNVSFIIKFLYITYGLFFA